MVHPSFSGLSRESIDTTLQVPNLAVKLASLECRHPRDKPGDDDRNAVCRLLSSQTYCDRAILRIARLRSSVTQIDPSAATAMTTGEPRG